MKTVVHLIFDHDSQIAEFKKRYTNELIADATASPDQAQRAGKLVMRAKPIRTEMQFSLQDYSQHETVLQEEERRQIEFKDQLGKKLRRIF